MSAEVAMLQPGSTPAADQQVLLMRDTTLTHLCITLASDCLSEQQWPILWTLIQRIVFTLPSTSADGVAVKPPTCVNLLLSAGLSSFLPKSPPGFMVART